MFQRVINSLNGLELYKNQKKFIDGVYELLGKELDIANHIKLEKQLVELEKKAGIVGKLLAAAKAQQDVAIGEAWKTKPNGHGSAQRNKAEVDEETYNYTFLRNMLEYLVDNINARLSLGKKLLEAT